MEYDGLGLENKKIGHRTGCGFSRIFFCRGFSLRVFFFSSSRPYIFIFPKISFFNEPVAMPKAIISSSSWWIGKHNGRTESEYFCALVWVCVWCVCVRLYGILQIPTFSPLHRFPAEECKDPPLFRGTRRAFSLLFSSVPSYAIQPVGCWHVVFTLKREKKREKRREGGDEEETLCINGEAGRCWNGFRILLCLSRTVSAILGLLTASVSFGLNVSKDNDQRFPKTLITFPRQQIDCMNFIFFSKAYHRWDLHLTITLKRRFTMTKQKVFKTTLVSLAVTLYETWTECVQHAGKNQKKSRQWETSELEFVFLW